MSRLAAAAAGAVLLTSFVVVAPASAYVVSKTVTVSHGVFGHGCRTVRTATRGFLGGRVVVKRVCR